MALIAMAVYDTEENQRTEYTEKTLFSLQKTVKLGKHRIIVIDNNSCKETKELLSKWKQDYIFPEEQDFFTIITLEENIGTAEAINKAWKHRVKGEHCIKMDNDVVIHYNNWVEEMEEAILRESSIGIIGLKRKDCWENPDNKDPFYKSELKMLAHINGDKWMVVEKVNHVMGTCQMYNSALLDQIGYLYQPKLYGFDDSFASFRSHKAGFINVFLPHIEIDHIDTGATPYQKWKEAHAGSCWDEYHQVLRDYQSGKKSIYYNPFKDGK